MPRRKNRQGKHGTAPDPSRGQGPQPAGAAVPAPRARAANEAPPDAPGPRPPITLRDQKWALHAYTAVGEVPSDARKDYKILVNDLGANILRSGLAAAMAAVERQKDRSHLLLGHLAGAGVTGLESFDGQSLPDAIRKLEVDGYMLATREILQVATWLKRAAQATFGDN